ncbi:uncharacterized protein LOC6562492 isoform X2 [Drosophila grimshawi]|uniref:uncharacterized protein LOC6562492 isoform X2 n=1 Tax=Drosophila grimshawi TaxID=7222 RepID=UPI000C8707A8|nr:uncharacterized protein LOC6562492 isoform X2 [Drosophila grimshawi]
MSINSDESINNLIDIENCDDISETYKPKAFEPELNASSTSTLREDKPDTARSSTNSIKLFYEAVIPEPIKHHCSAFRIASGQTGKKHEQQFEYRDCETCDCQFCCGISNADQSKNNSKLMAPKYGARETNSAEFYGQQMTMQMGPEMEMGMNPGMNKYSCDMPRVSYLDQSTSADHFHQSQMQTQSLTNVNNYEYMPQEAQMSGADGYLQSQPNNYYIESSADVNPGAPCSTPCSCNCPSRDYNDYDLGARQMQEDSAAAVQSDDYGMQETTAIHQCQVAQRMPREASFLEYRNCGQNTEQTSCPINAAGMPSCINNCGYPSDPRSPSSRPFPFTECCTSSCQQMPYYSYFPSNCVHGEHFIQNLRSTQPDCFPNYQTAPSSPPGMGMNMNYGPSCGPSYPPSCDPYSAGYYSNYSPSYGPPKNTIYGADDKLQAQTVYSTDFNPFSRPGNNLNHFPSYQASGSWGSFNDSNNCGTYPADFGSFNSGGIYMPPMCYNVQPCSSGGSCMLPPAGCVYGTPCPANYMSLPTTYCCPPSPATCHGAAPFPAPNTASYEMPSGCNQL